MNLRIHLRNGLVVSSGSLLLACSPGYLYEFSGAYGVSFEADSDCIEIDVSTVELTLPFTFDAYIRTDELIGVDYPIAVWPGSFALRQKSDGSMWVGLTSDTEGSALWVPTTIMDGAYHHVAISQDSEGIGRLFIDGTLKAEEEIDLLGEPGMLFYLGCWPGQSTFSGSIGEVNLSGSVLYSESFTPSWLEYAATDRTIALWHLNEGIDTWVFDEIGNAKGALQGDAQWVDFPMTGSRPQAQQE